MRIGGAFFFIPARKWGAAEDADAEHVGLYHFGSMLKFNTPTLSIIQQEKGFCNHCRAYELELNICFLFQAREHLYDTTRDLKLLSLFGSLGGGRSRFSLFGRLRFHWLCAAERITLWILYWGLFVYIYRLFTPRF